MDRLEWLKQLRRETEEKYTTTWAPLYGETLGFYPNTSHQAFIQKYLDLLPLRSTLLDAACGAGRYFPLLLERGHSVMGIDQSQGMVERARHFYPQVPVEKVGLQEMAFEQAFDGITCMDAIENVPPEDWPFVLSNFARALKPGGALYFTVEIADPEEIRQAYEKSKEAGLPVVYGEMPDEAPYHYYPALEQVRRWLAQAGFELIEAGEGDGYAHFLSRKA